MKAAIQYLPSVIPGQASYLAADQTQQSAAPAANPAASGASTAAGAGAPPSAAVQQLAAFTSLSDVAAEAMAEVSAPAIIPGSM